MVEMCMAAAVVMGRDCAGIRMETKPQYVLPYSARAGKSFHLQVNLTRTGTEVRGTDFTKINGGHPVGGNTILFRAIYFKSHTNTYPVIFPLFAINGISAAHHLISLFVDIRTYKPHEWPEAIS